MSVDVAHEELVVQKLSCSVVIATRNRPGPLEECLLSLATQTVAPSLVIIVDSSNGKDTQRVVTKISQASTTCYSYVSTSVVSAARQRNLGAEQVSTDLVLFLDDDVVLEADFVEEIVRAFADDTEKRVGGVGGTMANMVYKEPSGINRLLLGVCLGRLRGTYAGQVVGPAVNFIPADPPKTIQQVDWLPSTACAYRTTVFRSKRFGDSFEGYSFAEDLHLSTRVAKTHILLNTTFARLIHKDLGATTHRNWSAVSESMVVNRHMIMTTVLGKTRVLDYARLIFYEIVYCQLAFFAANRNSRGLKIALQMLLGKLRGTNRILRPIKSTSSLAEHNSDSEAGML